MELRHLRYFCSVAEHCSFTRAARQLHVSQSGVSGQVRDLETELGLSLFHRNQHEVRLTAEGVVFLREARDILSRVDEAVELTRQSSQGASGTLTVGLCGPVTAMFLPELVRTFRSQCPEVMVKLRERVPAEQVEALLKGELDVGFTRSVPDAAEPILSCTTLFQEPFLVAVAKDHALATQKSVALTELASSRLILYYREGAPEIHDAVMMLCKRARFTPQLGDSPPSWQSILTMVEAGEGVALVPACVQHLTGDVVFRPLRGKGPMLDAIAVWRKNETTPVVEKFLKLLFEKAEELGAAK